MRFLPVFLDLNAGPVVLAGTGELASIKLRTLMAANARIRWHGGTADILDELKIIEPDVRARIDLKSADLSGVDLKGVIAVLCARALEKLALHSPSARASGVPVNVMDDLAHSTFIFPAIVDRGDVIVAIGTGGSAPVLARRLREKIEQMLPARIGDLSAFIGKWRKIVHAKIPDMPLKRRFWEQVVDGPIGDAVLAGRDADAETMLTAIDDPTKYVAEAARGTVALVGAGPGDPDLLTIKALRALQDADVIFHDDLVSTDILDRARRDAMRVPVGRRRGQPGIGQDEINRRMIEAAREGKRVVRLKGGDSFIYGRGGEEMDALREAGVHYTIVPGITSALGAAAEFELPLTYRHEALRVAFITAHRADETLTIDWAGFADPKTTLVIYMGIASAAAVQQGLIDAGRDVHTPAGVFARATRPGSKAFLGTIENIPALAAQAGDGPALLVIGDVVKRSRPWRLQELSKRVGNIVVAA